jgi:tetratricopeptide (TPR) repeat protein
LLGDASYALYLTHGLVYLAVRNYLAPAINVAKHPLGYAMLLITCAVAVSIYIYLLFERPVTRLLQDWIARIVAGANDARPQGRMAIEWKRLKAGCAVATLFGAALIILSRTPRHLVAHALATAVGLNSPTLTSIDLDPVAALQHQADSKRAQGDLAGAIQDYSEAIRIGPRNTALYFQRSTLRLSEGDLSGAVGDVKAGLKLDPYDTALQGLSRQIRRAPIEQSRATDPDAIAAAELQHQADAKRIQGDLPGAIRDYGEAIRVGPPNTALYYLRGTSRLTARDLAGAVEDFEDGLELEPANPTLRQLLENTRARIAQQSPLY